MRFFFLYLLPFLLQAATIINYNIYDRSDRVDVMLTFDQPYKNDVIEQKSDNLLIIQLDNTLYPKKVSEQLKNDFVTFFEIKPLDHTTKLYFSIKQKSRLQVSKTVDGYGLRLRITQQGGTAAPATNQPNKHNESLKNIFDQQQTNANAEPTFQYYLVVVLLLIGIVVALYLRKKYSPTAPRANPISTSWLHKNNPIALHSSSITFEKAIDKNNKIVLLKFDDTYYLVLMGTTHLLLDSFDEDMRPKNEHDFSSMLRDNQAILKQFMQLQNNYGSEFNEEEEFSSYKEKASYMS